LQALDHFLAHYGYFAIFGLLMLGIVGPFIPDDTILVLSGLAVHRGELQLEATIAVAYAGSLCGITLSYVVGRTGLVYALERYKPIEHWVNHHLPEARKWFQRYGKWTLFFGYFIAGVRHFTALAAGMSRVKLTTFAAYAYPGGLVWVASFIAIGYYLGAEWEQIHRRFNRGSLIAAAIVAVIALIAWRLRNREARRPD
jgi:membrane protein DedA with SNARE-associated domain